MDLPSVMLPAITHNKLRTRRHHVSPHIQLHAFQLKCVFSRSHKPFVSHLNQTVSSYTHISSHHNHCEIERRMKWKRRKNSLSRKMSYFSLARINISQLTLLRDRHHKIKKENKEVNVVEFYKTPI